MPVLPAPSPTPNPLAVSVQPWCTLEDICAPCNDYAFDDVLLEDAIEAASNVLYEFTGRRWPGENQDVVRPCGMRSTYLWGRHDFNTGDLSGWCGCARPRECGCRRLSEIKLPGYPVVSVDEVKIDGLVIDPDRYRLDDHRWLVYLPDESGVDPRQGWPCCQRTDLADTEEDTFSVTYTFGQLPDRGGVMAAASLACQLALAFCPPSSSGASQCRLPKRVTSISRQGVTLAILDPLSLFKDGQTGLAEVDMWIGAKNYGAKKRAATARRVGQGRSVRRTNQ